VGVRQQLEESREEAGEGLAYEAYGSVWKVIDRSLEKIRESGVGR